MGYAKRLLEEEWERGFRSVHKQVCSRCVGHSELKSFIRNRGKGECSYCHKKRVVIDVDELFSEVMERISREYEDAGSAPWDSEEGRYFVDSYTIDDIADREFSDELFQSSELQSDFTDAFSGREWVQRDWQILNRSQGLGLSWREFCNAVKHRTRYLFFDAASDVDENDPEYIGPSGMLGALTDLISGYKLYRSIPVGSRYFRVRFGKQSYYTAADLGPPPKGKASQSRMSAAGIPCMYTSDDIETAIAEASEIGKPFASCATFEALMNLVVVDLTKTPPRPSILNKGSRIERGDIDFLRELVREISNAVEKDDRIHIEYVPTQIVSEYIRYQLKIDGHTPDGIVYPSSKGSGDNYVFFVDARDIDGTREMFARTPKFRLVQVASREYCEPGAPQSSNGEE